MVRPAVKPSPRTSNLRTLPRTRRQRFHRSKAALNPGRASFGLRHIFLLCLLLIAQATFFSSAMFRLQSIQVVGCENLKPGALLSQSGLKKGQPIWNQQPKQIVQRLKKIKNIQEVKVDYALPGRATIIVKERQAIFQVASQSLHPTWYAVDPQGLVLRRLKGASNRWPRLKLEEDIKVGQQLHPALLATCSQASQLIEKAFPRSIWYYVLDQRGNLSFRTFSGQYPVDVQMGNLENLPYKLKVLQALMVGEVPRRKVSAIDLRFAAPVVRLLHPSSELKKLEPKPE